MHRPQHIKIGVWGYAAVWEQLLDQIGVSWSTVESASAVEQYSLIIVNRPIGTDDHRLLHSYVHTGGALLYTVSEGQTVRDQSLSYQRLSSIPPYVSTEYSFNDIFDLHHKAFLFENDALIKVQPKEHGILSYLGIDVDALLSDSSSRRKNFYSQSGTFPHERVSRVSKNALFQCISSHLEFLHHRRSMPFVHKWYFPEDTTTLCTFRIDSDKGTKRQIEEIFQLGKRYDIPASWFLDVKSHEPWLGYFQRFGRQEVGVHCYEHTIYKSDLLTRENFEKALRLLRKNALDVHGITGPTGEWNTGLGKIFREMGFAYSSEFGYDYDNFPSFPIVGSEISPVVQLPVHPVCIGTLLREHYTTESMIRYFKDVIDRKQRLRKPICLYHHPTHGHNEVFHEIFQYIDSQNILKLSYYEYAEWWKRRDRFKFEASVNGQAIKFDGEHPTDAWVRISMPDTTEGIVPPRGEVPFESIRLTPLLTPSQRPNDIMRTRKFTLRHIAQNALDWWIKTTE